MFSPSSSHRVCCSNFSFPVYCRQKIHQKRTVPSVLKRTGGHTSPQGRVPAWWALWVNPPRQMHRTRQAKNWKRGNKAKRKNPIQTTQNESKQKRTREGDGRSMAWLPACWDANLLLHIKYCQVSIRESRN